MSTIPVFHKNHDYQAFSSKIVTAFFSTDKNEKDKTKFEGSRKMRSTFALPALSSTGCLASICIFCNKQKKSKRKMGKPWKECSRKNAEITIQDAAASSHSYY